jgi:hypothetical protein
VNAVQFGRALADNPDLVHRWEELTALPAKDFMDIYPRLQLREFAPGWVIIGQKPGGVEGGCIVRRIWIRADENFELGSGAHAAVADLHAKGQLGNFQRLTVEESLKILRSGDRSNPEFQRIYNLIQIHDEFQKSFMVKMLFGEDDVQNGRYYCPNARNPIHRQWVARNWAELRRASVEEHLALRVGRALAPDLVPEVRLGKIDDGAASRFFHMTQIGGSGTAGQVSFKTADKINRPIDAQNFNKEAFMQVYAITVGLLNDWDANADPNVGIMEVDGRAWMPFLFDMGHASPMEMTMDPQTLIPICRTNGLEASSFWQRVLRIVAFFLSYFRFEAGRFFTNPNFMTVGDRADALRNLIARQDDIWCAIEVLEGQFIGDEDAQRMVRGMRDTLMGRIAYVSRVLEEHDALMLESDAGTD